MQEYDIGHLVICDDVIGLIVDKRVDNDGTMAYKVEWADGFFSDDSWYEEYRIETFTKALQGI